MFLSFIFLSASREGDGIMCHEQKIVHGGGWFPHRFVAQPKARWFTSLAGAWLAISFVASIPFWDGLPRPFSHFDWLCASVVLLEPGFIALALAFSRWERPRTVSEYRPNPNYEVRKLY
jgi:hypothetical protein